MNRTNLNEASNGLLNGSYLTSIGGNHKLNSEAAVAYLKMVNAAKSQGVDWGITDSYRNLDAQKDVAKRKGLYSKGGLAAEPGTSNHGWGSALDLKFNGKGNALEWLKKNAATYGFTNIPREPWHWEHKQSAKNMGSNATNTTTDSPDSSGPNYDSSSSSSSSSSSQATDYNEEGKNLLKGVLSTNLGLDDLAKGFANVQEDIKRIKNLMK
jgi:D-alanyl-D-alanine dipeptidase